VSSPSIRIFTIYSSAHRGPKMHHFQPQKSFAVLTHDISQPSITTAVCAVPRALVDMTTGRTLAVYYVIVLYKLFLLTYLLTNGRTMTDGRTSATNA